MYHYGPTASAILFGYRIGVEQSVFFLSWESSKFDRNLGLSCSEYWQRGLRHPSRDSGNE
jgi:hypothetical protein